jgi:hypothetical protein
LNVTPLFLFLFAAVGANPLHPGDSFPELKGELLSGHNATLPSAAKGKIALLALGFSRDSQLTVEPWTKRYWSEFGKNDAVTFYTVPMIGSGGRFAKFFIESGMKRDVPKTLYDHFLIVFTDTDPWKARVSVKAENGAYLILLDGTGTVRWMHSGTFDEERFRELAGATRRLAGAR